MPTTRWNGIRTPLGSDAYNIPGDLASQADTTNVIVPVLSEAERDALTPPGGKYNGMTVARMDRGGALEVYSDGAWSGSSVPPSAYGSGWTPHTANNHTPRLFRNSNMCFLVGMVKRETTAGALANILTVPLDLRPVNPETIAVGTTVTSGLGETTSQVFDLFLQNGILKVEADYGTDTLGSGVYMPVTSFWPLY